MDWGEDEREKPNGSERDALLPSSTETTQRMRINTDGFRYSRSMNSDRSAAFTRRRPRSLDDSRNTSSLSWRSQGYENLFNVSPGFSPKVPIPDDGMDIDAFAQAAAKKAVPPKSAMHGSGPRSPEVGGIGGLKVGSGESGYEYSGAFKWRLFWAYTGPGWLMSVAYVDPGNIESDLQAGGYAGYSLLWVLLVSTLLGLMLQVLAVRLGVVTGHNLAEVCRKEYTSVESFTLYLMMQLAIVGSDIQEIVGSAIAFRVLFGIPLWIGCLVTGIDTFTFLSLQAAGIRKLEALFAVLIGTMCVCFFATFCQEQPEPTEILQGLFVPTVKEQSVVQAVSILGAVVMPHNLYLHSALVMSRDIDRSRVHKIREANWYFTLEAALALFVSLLINIAIVSVFASGFYSEACESLTSTLILAPSGEEVRPPFACVPFYALGKGDGHLLEHTQVPCTSAGGNMGTCMPIGLQGAGYALQSLLGNKARILWAIGLLGAGQSSTMSGTYAGQFVMEGFLKLEIPNWVRVALTRSIALVPATIVALIANTDYLAADRLDEWLNVLQSIQLPFALLPLLHFTSRREIMGDEFKNGFWLNTVGWLAAILVFVINAFLVYRTLATFPFAWDVSTGVLVLATVAYVIILVRLVRHDCRRFYHWTCRALHGWPAVEHHVRFKEYGTIQIYDVDN